MVPTGCILMIIVMCLQTVNEVESSASDISFRVTQT